MFKAFGGFLLLLTWLPAFGQTSTVNKDGETLYSPAHRFDRVRSIQTESQSSMLNGNDATCTTVAPGIGYVCDGLTATFAKAANNVFFNQAARYIHPLFTGPSWNFGNPNGVTGSAGWRSAHGFWEEMTVASRGPAQALSLSFEKHSTGDSAAIYAYHHCDGGVYAGSDEGCGLISMQGGEPATYFHGRIARGGMGAVLPRLTYTSGSAWTTDGTFLLDISRGTLSGVLGQSTALPRPYPSYLAYLPVTSGSALPLSTAACLVVVPAGATMAVPNPATTPDKPVTLQISCALQPVKGTRHAFATGDHVCIAGSNFPEQSTVTASSAPVDGVQSFSVLVTKPNGAATIFRGPLCGQYLSFDRNLEVSGMRSAYYAFGSLTGTDLIYGNNILGQLGLRAIPDATGGDPAYADRRFHLYPGAEVVINNSAAYDPTLEPNVVDWTPGDLVENPHAHTIGGHVTEYSWAQYSPTNSYFGSFGLKYNFTGAGISADYQVAQWAHDNPDRLYRAKGGPLSAPHLFRFFGAYGDGLVFDQAPQPGFRSTGAILEVDHTTDGGPFVLMDLPGVDPGARHEVPHGGQVKWDAQHGAMIMPGMQIPALKAKTGTRFLCIDQDGYVVSQTVACSGT